MGSSLNSLFIDPTYITLPISCVASPSPSASRSSRSLIEEFRLGKLDKSNTAPALHRPITHGPDTGVFNHSIIHSFIPTFIFEVVIIWAFAEGHRLSWMIGKELNLSPRVLDVRYRSQMANNDTDIGRKESLQCAPCSVWIYIPQLILYLQSNIENAWKIMRSNPSNPSTPRTNLSAVFHLNFHWIFYALQFYSSLVIFSSSK